MIYQLRLPIALGLDGLFLKLVKSLEQALGRPLPLDLQGTVARDLEKHLLSFDTCGCSVLCDEATVPSRWNKDYEPFLLSPTNEDRDKVLRLHLHLPGDSLERFAGGLARYLDGHLVGQGDERRAQAAAVIFSTFAPYTFHGEICRTIDLCKSAEARPVSISVVPAA